jgi:hypothetical protein
MHTQITWTSDISPLKDGGISEILVDDVSDAFVYRPDNAWSNKTNMSSFASSTGQWVI